MRYKQIRQKLEEGNKRYQQGESKNRSYSYEVCKNLVDVQRPFAIVLSCSDSRVIPEYIFDVDLGELFVCRIAGNIVTEAVAASIEFVVSSLDCVYLLILGHQNCGAVNAALNSTESLPNNLKKLVENIKPKVTFDKDLALEDLIKENVNHSALDVLKFSDYLKQKYSKKEFLIEKAYFSIETGQVEFLD